MPPLSNPVYPRGLPYQTPGQAPAPQPLPAATAGATSSPAAPVAFRYRREWIVAAVGALVLAVVVGVVLFRSGRPTTEPRTANDRMLETLGGLCASHLYQSYLNIGLLADAVDNQTYTQAQAQEMLGTVVSLMDTVDRQLDKLIRNDLTDDDKRDVERIRTLSALLRVQVLTLRNYWSTGSAEQAARYHQAREKAWQGLSEVLGL